MDKKKVLHVIECFDIAGAEIIVKDLLLNLPSSEWQVEVCVLNDIGILGKELRDSGYTIHYLNWKGGNLTDLQVARKLKHIIDDRKIDLVHAHNVTPWYFSTLASLNKHVKRCVTIHGFIRGDGALKKKILYSLLSKFTSKIVIVSQDIEKQLRGIPFFSIKKVEVILNGVDIKVSNNGFNRDDKRKELGFREDDFLLGTVSRIYPEKNIEMQIKLIHSLTEEIPNVKLVVIGKKYEHAKNLEALARGLNVQDRVFFLGLRRDVPELLRTLDIFLMTSFSEGTSLAILEAMATGLPVVASDVGGNKNLINHGENGLLFQVDNFSQLQNLLLELYKNADNRKEMGLRAEKKALSFEKKKMVNAYLSLYSTLINN